MSRISGWAVRYALVLALLVAVSLASTVLAPPYRGHAGSVVVEIEPRTPSRVIAQRLEASGVIPSRWHFMAVRLVRPRTVLMAGEYEFGRPMSVWEVFDTIARGQVRYHPVTIPEGHTLWGVADLVARTGFAGREDFLKETERVDYVRDLLPEAVNLEGCLFPDTYHVARPVTAEKLVRIMVGRFRDVFTKVLADNKTSLNAYEILTLASMIEKETGVGHERQLVSSVFHNRLRRGMLLQCDPTVVYGMVMENRYRGRLLISDLEDTHRYNTYVHPGLPPGPIANPGRKSLEAAINPKSSDYIFFVAHASGNGEHVFSETWRDHERAVAGYRQRRHP